MNALIGLATLAGYYPLLRAWSVNRLTTLRAALAWSAAAWTAWSAAAFDADATTLSYLALSLTGCAGVAVLGARRPGVGAWNFVVGGLLVVLLLPVASGFGTPRLETPHLIFLGATLAVVLLNHLPTRPGVAVPLVGAACAAEMFRFAGVDVPVGVTSAGRVLLALAPWAAWLATHLAAPIADADRIWLGFRDRYGFLWAQRVRDQFSRSIASSGSAVRLNWTGIRPSGVGDGEAVRTLQALLKRFGPPGGESE